MRCLRTEVNNNYFTFITYTNIFLQQCWETIENLEAALPLAVAEVVKLKYIKDGIGN